MRPVYAHPRPTLWVADANGGACSFWSASAREEERTSAAPYGVKRASPVDRGPIDRFVFGAPTITTIASGVKARLRSENERLPAMASIREHGRMKLPLCDVAWSDDVPVTGRG